MLFFGREEEVGTVLVEGFYQQLWQETWGVQIIHIHSDFRMD